MTASRARKASLRRNAAQRRAADQAASDAYCPTSTESDDYGPDTAFIIAADIYDNHLDTCIRERLESGVVDQPKHSAAPRTVTVRLLVIALIALALQGKDPHLKRIAASLCSHRRIKNRRVRQLRKKTRRKHLKVPKNQYVSYAMVQHTFALLDDHLAADISITGTDGEPVTDTLINWLGIELPQASIRASGDADLYATTGTVAVDTTILESFADHTNTIDETTGEIISPGYDPDARWNHKTETNRKRGGTIVSYQYEAVVAVRDLAPNRDRHSPNTEPFPGTTIAARFHNENHNAEQAAQTLKLLDATGHHIHTAIADRGFSQSTSTKWAAALRGTATGIEPVHDLRKNQRGHRPFIHTFTDTNNQPASSLATLDGTLFEAHIITHLERIGLTDLEPTEWIVTAKNRDQRNGTTDAQTARLTNINKFDTRDAFAWKQHDRIGPWTGRYRGPAHTANPTAWCRNWPKSHRHQHRLPKTPCQPDTPCNCGRLITLRLNPELEAHEEFNKIRQHRHYGTTAWHSLYGAGRALAESAMSPIRGNLTNHAQPLTTRVSGTRKRALVTLAMTVATNTRLIATHRQKRGLEPNPHTEPTNQPHNTAPDSPRARQHDTHPPSGTDPPTAAHTPATTP